MKIKVTEQGATIPKELLQGVEEIEIYQESDRLVLIPTDNTRRPQKAIAPFTNPDEIEKQLVEMAQDPHIQAELAAIDGEFSVADLDGLETA